LAEQIRVLRAIARLNMGGPALHVSYLARGLDERGYETTLVAGELARGEDTMAYVAEEQGVEVRRVGQLRREVSPLNDPFAIARMVKLIRDVRPHILHTHTAKAGAVGRTAALLAGDARPPIVVHTYHGHVLRGYFDPARTQVFRETERLLALKTTRLIAVGPQVKDDLVRLGVAPPEKFAVIRLGIDLAHRVVNGTEGMELRRQFGIPDDRFVVGWIGRMTQIKRIPDVLLTFRRLLDRSVDATLCLVGDGPDREDAEARARELGIARRTLFLGYQRDVAPYYSLFDAFLLTSANEGTPVVAIESLAAERPVVSTRVGGVPDVVDDGEDGFLAEVGDADGLAERLERLARDADLRRRFGQTGRARVLPRYAVPRLVDDVDALYRELLDEAGISPPPRG
jgi:glycosyltransferase involved in cell wall biosynthesis